MTVSPNIAALALAAWLALTLTEARAETPRVRNDPAVEFSDGLRGRILNGKVKRAKLVFDQDSVTVAIKGWSPERFRYGELTIRRGRHHLGVPLFSRGFWWTALPSVGLTLVTSGLGGAAYHAGALLAGAHSIHLLRRRRSTHWLSLHSAHGEHRCVFLSLPANKKLRTAIFEELARRDPKQLRVREPVASGSLAIEPFPAPGEAAPDFELHDLQGPSVGLSDLRGKVVLLNFWATWCGPCRKELPHLEHLQQTHSDSGLVVLGVSDEKPDHARQFLAERGITYRALHDEGSLVFRRYGVTAVPTTLVVGRDGVISARIEGYMNKSALARAVRPHIASPLVLNRR